MIFVKMLVIYLPFEEFILKWFPVSDVTYSLLRQAPDLLVLGLMGALMLGRLSKGKAIPLVGDKVDLFLMLFVCWAFITLLLNSGSDTFLGIANIKALLRYVLLVYILLLLNPTENQVNKLMYWFWLVIIMQLLVGLFQFVGGVTVRDILSARHADEGIGGMVKSFTGDKFEGVNDLMGTMGDNIKYAYFLMIGFTFWLFKEVPRGIKLGGISLFFLTLIYHSGSKAVFLTSVMVLTGYFVWLYGWKKLVIWLGFVSPLCVVFLWLIISGDRAADIQASSTHLLEGMMNSRLGIIVYILPKLLLSAHNIIGFSPDKYFFAEFVVISFPMIPTILSAVLPNVLEDVYWVAMYIYYGLIGFACWTLFLVFLYKRIRKSIGLLSLHGNHIAITAMVLLLTTIPLNLLNQAFEARTFSFYLWLFCGLALVLRRRAIREKFRQ